MHGIQLIKYECEMKSKIFSHNFFKCVFLSVKSKLFKYILVVLFLGHAEYTFAKEDGIAINKKGEMLGDLSNMSLGVRGTRFNVGITIDGKSKVALAEDSFGDVGEIEISSEGQKTNLNTTDQVVEVSEDRKVDKREQSVEEKDELKSVSETLVKVSKIDENELEQQLQEKLEKCKLEDANNDGVVDESDVAAAKEIIKEEKY